jgi:phytoene synthase
MREGSKSFSAASRVLPERVRTPATIVYAFCRISDDAVDGAADPAAGFAMIAQRLDAIYAGTPSENAVDRALAGVVRDRGLPRAVFDALLEGYRWDVEHRRYESLDDLQAYCMRVAGTVGVIMTLLMGCNDAVTLARACDLGVAMQLTNICRDVGEDARNGRVYLPLAWLREAGVDVEAWLANPTMSRDLGAVVERVLAIADELYARADLGIRRLPHDCRAAIRAARLIYADIGRIIRQNGHDAISQRAVTSKARKLALLARAYGSIFWRPRPTTEPALAPARFLIDAVARGQLT